MSSSAEPSVAADRRCMNCGAVVPGIYCPQCGQKDDDLRRPIWSFLVNFVDDIFSIESRVWRTLLSLLFLPGVMTRRYLEGKRQHYTPPLRLYLITSLLFFLLLGASDIALVGMVLKAQDDAVIQAENSTEAEPSDEDEDIVFDGDGTIIVNGQTLSPEDSAKVADLGNGIQQIFQECYLDPKAFVRVSQLEEHDAHCREIVATTLRPDALPEEVGYIQRVMNGFQRALDEPARINQAFNILVPRAMVILLPMMALYLRLVHWRKGQFLFNHLIFSLHFHTFLFALLIGIVGYVRFIGGLPPPLWIGVLILAYLLLAMKFCYRQGWAKTIFKTITVAGLHFGLLQISVGSIALLGLAEI